MWFPVGFKVHRGRSCEILIYLILSSKLVTTLLAKKMWLYCRYKISTKLHMLLVFVQLIEFLLMFNIMKCLPCARVCAGDGEYNSEPDKFHPIGDPDLKRRMEM